MINLKYKDYDLSVYNNFLNECLTKDYLNYKTHKHHILPKFMGGTNDERNIIKLSYADHYKAHILLANCFDDNLHEHTGNILGAWHLKRLIGVDHMNMDVKVPMSLETIQKILDAKVKSGSMIFKDGKYSYSDAVKFKMRTISKVAYQTGKRVSPFKNMKNRAERDRKMVETRRKTGSYKPHTDEHKRKLSDLLKGKNVGSKNGMYGKQISDEHRRSLNLINSERQVGGKNNMAKRTKCNISGIIFDCAKDASRYYGVTYAVIRGRINRGLLSYV